MYQIEWVGMTRNHFQPGSPDRIRMIVLHATAGSYPGDFKWLRQGGAPGREVSVHYYITKRGQIFQLVADHDIAWHAGVSRWEVDGRTVYGCNEVSLGIELENRNDGRDPYPPEQYAAALWLVRELVQKYHIPPNQVVRHLDISPGRKTDPAGFPWQQFLDEVFADLTAAPSLPVGDRLRQYMLDIAYRAAGSGLPSEWPFWTHARAAKLGMPVASLVARPLAPRPAAAPNDRERALSLPDGTRYLVEVYARDALCAEVGADDTFRAGTPIERLSTIPASPQRMALLEAIFRAVDPVNGFQPGWAFHQYFLRHLDTLGMPISYNHRLALTAGLSFACQHFALDSLCSPVGQWQVIYRLSELRQAAAGQMVLAGLSRERADQLAHLLLDDLFALRTGRRYHPEAALVQYALTEELGSPLAPAETAVIDGIPVALMPFALDVVACRLPTPDWPLERPLPPSSPFGRLTALLSGLRSTATGIVRLSRLNGQHLSLSPMSTVPLLGPSRHGQPLIDVSLFAGDGEVRRQPIDTILIVPVPGPTGLQLPNAHIDARWHYYIDHTGMVYRLRHERFVARTARGVGRPAERLDQRALVVAVEGLLQHSSPRLRSALQALVHLLRRHFRIRVDRVQVLEPAAGVPVTDRE
ncbi:MAG: N-acetylmuramoyl-L-alanine amidase [Chloroflexus sp.]|uniref:N-acetylmuramoyl-L-alanine amidase n=1 Tax=Chloroflexus sp. TaxID=1904827 RepID=UPI0021DE29DC|nr:N-acetylmuramoyl-L-alanine amidase [Chloroflexus sp.]GIV88580.1 MAG: N-acetylmuramoyl-L-alanine amidase [Chloroflexus sp.]